MQPLEQLRAGALAGTRRLTLRAELSELPPEIFELADTLEVLDLSGNALSALPDDLPRLRRLRILFCSNNRFTELPAVLGRCEQLEMVGFKANQIRHVPAEALPAPLRWLILTDNQIEALPDTLGRCSRLQKLALAGNRLQSLPASMAACSRLELLRISANQLRELPAWLTALPRLSWLAYAGNPFCEALEQAALTQTPMPITPWPSLSLEARLGEGASGVIHRATNDRGEAVAVKIFKGELTSDGLPRSEMAASMRAGVHPSLIPVLGRVADHPAQAMALVMQLIAPQFRNLAGPPSLASCTRDVYAEDTRFEPGALLSLACGIASAMGQLHRRGITHGDLYAHNILHDGQGQAYLGDFGAASFFSATDTAAAEALQRVEARAFGCLLEELIGGSPSLPPALSDALSALVAACLQEAPECRPLFDDIERTLQSLAASQGNAA
jgi:Protein kinase domain/Leucine rich repeat